MKKILCCFLLSLFVSSTVFAASLNGDYHGNPIVRIDVDGRVINPEVPGHIVDGSTMLPLRAVSEALGAEVTWDQSTYQAHVKMPKLAGPVNVSISEIASSLSLNHVEQVMMSADAKGYSTIEFTYTRPISENDKDFNAIVNAAITTNASMFKLTDSTSVYRISLNHLRNYRDGVITLKTLNENYDIRPKGVN